MGRNSTSAENFFAVVDLHISEPFLETLENGIIMSVLGYGQTIVTPEYV